MVERKKGTSRKRKKVKKKKKDEKGKKKKQEKKALPSQNFCTMDDDPKFPGFGKLSSLMAFFILLWFSYKEKLQVCFVCAFFIEDMLGLLWS